MCCHCCLGEIKINQGVDGMKVTITGRKINLRESFKEYTQKKLQKVDRFFGDDADAQVTVSLEKDRKTVEITVKNKGTLYRAEETAYDPEEALDAVIDSLVRKIRKNKTRVEKRLKESAFAEFPAEDRVEEDEYEVVRVKRFPVKPLDVEEAILQMNLSDHQFYMFRNVDSGDINVVYRRHDGRYGLIDPES